MRYLCAFLVLSLAPVFTPDAQALGKSRTVEIRSKNYAAVFKIDEAFSPEQREIIIQDLQFIASIESEIEGTPTYRKIFGGRVHGDTFLPWLRKRVGEIRYAKSGTRWEFSDAIAYSMPNSFWYSGWLRDAIFLTDHYFLRRVTERAADQLARSTTIIHEARHKDKIADRHVPCAFQSIDLYDRLGSLDPFVSAKPACDDISEGAYGAGLLFAANVAKTGADFLDREEFPLQNYASRIMDRNARRVLNEELFGPMVPHSFVDEAAFDDEHRVRVSLERGVSSHELDEALEAAFRRYHFKMVELLISAGANFERIRSGFQFTSSSLETFSTSFIERLVRDHGVPLETGSSFPILTYVACNREKADVLIQLGSDPCAGDERYLPGKFVTQCTFVPELDRQELERLFTCPKVHTSPSI